MDEQLEKASAALQPLMVLALSERPGRVLVFEAIARCQAAALAIGVTPRTIVEGMFEAITPDDEWREQVKPSLEAIRRAAGNA